jgi:hypothetical protein
MTINRHFAAERAVYEAGGVNQTAIDMAFDAMRDVLEEELGIKCANDDRAENLISAIVRYVMESHRP